ncbi:alpha-N-acetylglucosaminidase isoform X1 [Populus alba x Populus x berolinensis]|uniref:Alpha-N-acetylglucosaminidase n=1 Tax=Populus davidiana TaxID=266767 RepID=A0A6M2F0M9_9ROSI|nr:alpha-N-acetylglucosaminidase isoform X1 [Populus alba x Populus x berolinensis]
MSTLKTLIFTTTLLILTLSSVALSRPEAIDSLLKRLDSKRASSSDQESAAKAVLKRLLPSHIHSFLFKIVSKDVCGGHSCFLINNYYKESSGNGPEISIKGTTAVEIASGLHWYLKYWCGAHVSWDKTGGVQIASIPKPGSLPHVKDKGVMIQRPVPWNYYQNVVTSSYSYVWWNWERWEKELDWMALQGINLPLAFTGQEAIWQKVFMNLNITTEDLNDFFGGPAFLAWARMGNLHGWGGPLSQNWLDQQLFLQKQILSRMLELGMTPVLPSFSGNVPAALKKIFPSANITRLGDWNTVDKNPRWCCTYLLNPSDPLFVEIGEAFIRQQVKEYGDVTDIYNCDTFNENSPPTSDPAYISSLGAAVYKAMSRGDKDAVWLMQGWLFYSDSSFWKPPQMQALLHSVPFGKMIVLDLFAEAKPIWKNSSQFYGTPYVWCLLHNFGGNIEMYGILDAISSGPVDARISENSTMVGVGMCMEGIEHNPVVYELMSEMAFRSGKPLVLEWLKTYSRRRYGKAVHQVVAAWDILYHTVYNCTDGIADHNTDFIVKFPDWDPSLHSGSNISQQDNMRILLTSSGTRRFLFHEKSSDFPVAHLWYSTQEVIQALWLFLDAGNDLAGSLTYRYDLVDLTRQVLSKLANQVYRDAMIAFRRKDARALNLHGQKFLQIIKDIDVLLASDDNFLLGTWLESAKKLAVDPNDMKLYEWNARTQVTMWYDTTKTNQSQLHDYANKFWSGLLEDYYLPRASTYFGHLMKSLEENKNFKLTEWRKEWIAFSNKWQADTKIYPVKAKGDALAIAKALYRKYFG